MRSKKQIPLTLVQTRPAWLADLATPPPSPPPGPVRRLTLSSPVYERSMLLDPAAPVDEHGALQVDTGRPMTTRNKWILGRIHGHLGRNGCSSTVGAAADELKRTPEEIVEAVLGWGYWAGFVRDLAHPIRDWPLYLDGE
jgi:hypothetical protein